MASQLTVGTLVALFGAIAALAAVPSLSVLTVSARSASLGFFHGALTTAGIVLGDLIFIAIAVWGLAFFAEQFSPLFIVIKGFGGLYLLWLGYQLWELIPVDNQAIKPDQASWASSLLMGLSITLGDQKAILFYFGFFPAFLNLATLTVLDWITVMAIAAIAVGSVKLAYAYLADRARSRIRPKFHRLLNRIAATVLAIVGLLLLSTTILELLGDRGPGP
ncbi:MAG: LysE family translocator [Cyanophyceae cyanobacterium]